MKSCLVVISHYNAWTTDQLLALLDQIRSIPAGYMFQCRVVVNQAEPKPLDLPDRHADVDVRYRENTGYNLGAWDHGWRQEPAFDYYLFLQEECVILRPGWVEAFVRRAAEPRVGLVGESLDWLGMSWDRLDLNLRLFPFPAPVDGRQVSYPTGVRLSLERHGIPPGVTGDHLQSLVFCCRRSVLEAIDGFSIGETYAEAVVAEVAASKRVQSLGLRTSQVGLTAFRYILHPQWGKRKGGVIRAVLRFAEPYVPIQITGRVRKIAFALYARRMTRKRQLAEGRSIPE